MKQEIQVRATRESPGHVHWCKEEDADQFSVYQGWPGDMKWVADFAAKNDALDFGRLRALMRKCGFADRIGEGV